MPSLNDVTTRASKGSLDPVYVLVGTERLLIERVVDAVRKAVDAMGAPGFNVEVFDGKGLDAARVISAARTLPMMADTAPGAAATRRRDDADRTDESRGISGRSERIHVLRRHSRPSSTDARSSPKPRRRRACSSTQSRSAGESFESSFVRRRRHASTTLRHRRSKRCSMLSATTSPRSTMPMERLSLFVGAGQRIDADAVMTCVTRIRVDSIWSLVDAIGLKDRRKGIAAAQSLLDDREPPLRLLAMVARQLRIVARMREALSEGLRPQEAAKRAGAPPFKAADLTESARRFTAG